MSFQPKPGSQQELNINNIPKEPPKASEDVIPPVTVHPIRVHPLVRPPAPVHSPPQKTPWDLFNPATEDFVLLDPATPCF